MDTCKIEHLISDETAQRLAWFLRFLGSGQEGAKDFLPAWRDYGGPGDRDGSARSTADRIDADASVKDRK